MSALDLHPGLKYPFRHCYDEGELFDVAPWDLGRTANHPYFSAVGNFLYDPGSGKPPICVMEGAVTEQSYREISDSQLFNPELFYNFQAENMLSRVFRKKLLELWKEDHCCPFEVLKVLVGVSSQISTSLAWA